MPYLHACPSIDYVQLYRLQLGGVIPIAKGGGGSVRHVQHEGMLHVHFKSDRILYIPSVAPLGLWVSSGYAHVYNMYIKPDIYVPFIMNYTPELE